MLMCYTYLIYLSGRKMSRRTPNQFCHLRLKTVKVRSSFRSGKKLKLCSLFYFSLHLCPYKLRSKLKSERIQDGRESERPAESFMSNQTQNKTRVLKSLLEKSTELSNFNAVASDYHCCLCDKNFTSNHRLINHAFRTHSEDQGALCAVCGKTIESSDSLNGHLKSHESSKCCYVCFKRYKSITSLTDHMVSHAGVKLHRCHVCERECRRKGDLKIHMRIHMGEKPFCSSYCQSFTHSGHLKKHMRSHTGQRPHRCDICGRGFLQSTHLKYHLGTHG